MVEGIARVFLTKGKENHNNLKLLSIINWKLSYMFASNKKGKDNGS